MLSDMNGQFTAMQAAFSTIIQKAEESTSNHMASGQQQIEKQSALIEGLMVRLSETAEQNVSGIRNQLGAVVSDLAQKVGDLSKELMSSAQKVAQESQASANKVVEKAGDWSEATAQRLDSLMGSMEARSADFTKAGQELRQFQESLKATIGENQKALAQMAEASKNVKIYSEGLAGQMAGLKTLSENQVQVTVRLKEASANMDTTFQKHSQFLQQYQQLFKSYEGTFESLDSRIAKIMGSVNQGMQQYTQQVERNFREIVKTANEMLPDIVKKLDAQTEGVAEQLEELSDVIAKGLEKLNGGKR
jgi:ABC-type transporter Mla subunit MlaD